MLMHETMRWFGPHDIVSLKDIRQSGCAGVVTALHHIPVGDVWPVAEIQQRKSLIEAEGMSWTVVESLPVSEDIKRRSGNYPAHIENYKKSLQHLAACGIKVVTYNFMPVLDWVRTDISHTMPDGSKALYYERAAFVAFDLFMLKRPHAEKDYSAAEIEAAERWLHTHTDEQKNEVFRNALLGLPGSTGRFTPEEILAALETYKEIDASTLREHLFYFLKEVMPVAEQLGLKMAIHPDDPPYAVLGLPRVVSLESDLFAIVNAVPSPANGLCYCTGSLGVRPGNDLTGIIRRLGAHIHFLHLRNTRRDASGNFFEAGHLDGDADMVAIVRALLLLMKQRNVSLPVRPDHGHQMLDDLAKTTYPGYSCIGRLKGLAELRGLQIGLASVL
ncbi:mannonate dehydratase [Chitinophaga ginsengisegetis]|uniref:mannonate dehydratase n=1 Tax=Chitinophaga ginsengisegetis TaxID=393003 RepID=UPI000DBF8B48|nr:mannonate dehydratase [Chitinophaga ginsengisegetis]MDR6568677.1 mannonate dehydratase [Chitinophaga ginsengisegetis]MDR6648092.1 mannonate dehydratase [Chitinophaga ginsengisegetis]MDR6654758.1 mannonate dehydratase [Chitinophaga ginsengisegetis]